MVQNSYEDHIVKPWTPGIYHIDVEGEVDKIFSARLGGVKITTSKKKDQSTVTTLTGEYTDQAALLGVLNSLSEMHFPLLLVKRL